MKALKGEIAQRGICLKNGKEYGGRGKLAQALRNNGNLIVPVDRAKEFKLAKKCLVIV